MTEPIKSFTGDYAFLSNFYCEHIEYEGDTYASNEHAYQAAKIRDRAARHPLTVEAGIQMTPGQAKRFGRSVTLRPFWNAERVKVMEFLQYRKFVRSPHLATLLIATGDAELIEGNRWGDTFWGVCNGVGQNQLGKILMDVRAAMRLARGIDQ